MSVWPDRLFLLLAATLAAALAWEAASIGVTADEPSHLLSSCLYWKGQDNLLPRDMPPLIKIIGGWVPCALQIPIPYDAPAFGERNEWVAAQAMMERIDPARIQHLYFLSRLPMLIFPLLSASLIFTWMKELTGPWLALLAAALFAFEPTSLGHGALFKNDHAATATFLFFWYRAWKFWRNPAPSAVLLLGLSVLLAVMAKLSMLILIGIGPGILIARWWSARARYSLRSALLGVLGILVILYGGLLATSWFDIGFLTRRELFLLQLDSKAPNWAFRLSSIFEWLPAPRLYWEGTMSLFNSNSAGSPVYLLGDVDPNGSPFYFLVASAFKLPFTLQILFVAGTISLLWDSSARGNRSQTAVFLLVPPVLYASLCSLTSLQLGIRLILPIFPFLTMIGAHSFVQRNVRFQLATSILLLRFTVQTIRYFPYGISFFNLWAGGPDNGIHFLADSNLDWGQDLPALNRWFRGSGVKHFNLFYFGNDQPSRFFSDEECQRLRPPWNPAEMSAERFVPAPGYYAISVNLLLGHFFDDRFRNYFQVFRNAEPVARAGHSILIFRVARPLTD